MLSLSYAQDQTLDDAIADPNNVISACDSSSTIDCGNGLCCQVEVPFVGAMPFCLPEGSSCTSGNGGDKDFLTCAAAGVEDRCDPDKTCCHYTWISPEAITCCDAGTADCCA
ncbi:hypothetical protein Slin15195_G041440 [Septoria linicola]|uniref:Uncharacterized protein n=1 Tax=Septoria linicola TaxID=215465 RepID=A0A9Q9AKQ9_9PEZI|nr:hypothetical protein Slin14017_G044960 [Septoria linicola]USW50825.1 hypothetical protein Slin15195_G041440 [Septoria linicola]